MIGKGRIKSQQKRLQILDAAISLFTELGFNNTSMDRIAALAEVSKQTVYSHFESKEQLFVAAVGQKCIAHELTEAVFDERRELRETLILIAMRFNELILSDAAVKTYRTCVAQAETHPQVSELYFKAGPRRVIAQVAEFLERVVASGRLQIDSVGDAAMQFLLMAQSRDRTAVELGLPKQQSDAERMAYLNSCVDLFLRGYAPRTNDN